MRALIPLFLMACCAASQTVPQHRITVGGGWSRNAVGDRFTARPTAAGPGASYGYRFHRYIEAEAGLFTALEPTGAICSRFGCTDVHDRFFWLPFGVRFIAPPYFGRVELSGGGGGLYQRYTVGHETPGGGPWPRHGWGGYFAASAAAPLDHSRRFWVGVTPRLFLANPPYARDRWLQVSGELSLRFR